MEMIQQSIPTQLSYCIMMYHEYECEYEYDFEYEDERLSSQRSYPDSSCPFAVMTQISLGLFCQ